jgi:Sec-independent protein translocase protein TatA
MVCSESSSGWLGPSRLTGLGGSLGKTIRDFRKAVEGSDDDDHSTPSKPLDSTPPDSTLHELTRRSGVDGMRRSLGRLSSREGP